MAAAAATTVQYSSSSQFNLRNSSSKQRSSSVRRLQFSKRGAPVSIRAAAQLSPVPSSSSPVLIVPTTSSSDNCQIQECIQALEAAIQLQKPRSQWDQISLWSKTAERDAAAARAARASWNPFQKLAAAALDAVEERLIPLLEGGELPSTSDPAVQLAGNFAPVDEVPPTMNLEVTGTLPSCLAGLYVRNGANPRYRPMAGHHLFDGDGMLHSVRIQPKSESESETESEMEASYCARFTRTHRFREEQRLGRPIFPKPVGELHGHGGAARLLLFYARGMFGIVDSSGGMGPANAGLVFFDGRLLAMSEDDKPYAVSVRPEDGELTTMGRYDFQGQLECSSMIAHPKKDATTGELFALSYDVVKQPYLRYFSFAADGTKRPDVEITLQGPTMMHDFAITERFVVIPDQQVVFQLPRMLSGKSPVVYDPSKAARFGVLPKYDTDERNLKWIQVPGCFCFHVWNAWEEDEDNVVVLGSCMTPPDCVFNDEQPHEEMSSILCEIRLNLKTGTSTRTPVAGINLEAGMVNRKFLGKKSRFLYHAIADPWPMISGVAKVDLSLKTSDAGVDSGVDCVVGKRIHGSNCYGGEPFFVPRSSDPNAPEDDGYVLTFVHNESTGKSELLVLDASTDNLDLVASIKLPSRVPYGFHGTFVSEEDLATQSS